MGELLGCLLGGWIWVALGRAVGSRASWNTDKVTVAGLVASAALVVALVLARRTPGGYTKDEVRDWAAAAHARIAIVQLTWGWVPPQIPAEWRKVAELTVLPERRVIGFFAVDPGVSSLDVRGDVGEFFTPMLDSGRYALRLF